ncbi:MAG: hypothetical protein KDA20_09440 [Phycisphaerales bacterium]|nr:hypothetical protein [Phycisphaerales bacterium]
MPSDFRQRLVRALLVVMASLAACSSGPTYFDDPFTTASGNTYRLVGRNKLIQSIQMPEQWIAPWKEGESASTAWKNRLFAVHGDDTLGAWEEVIYSGLRIVESYAARLALLEIEPATIGALLPPKPFAARSWIDAPMLLVFPYPENLDLMASGLVIWTSTDVRSERRYTKFDEPVRLSDLMNDLQAYLPKDDAENSPH